MPPAQRPILVSACLLGRPCRYDGRSNTDGDLERQLESENLRPVPFCPEEHGGLGTPRPPAWIETDSAEAVLRGEDRVVTDEGRDVTQAFRQGAEGALDACREHGINLAILKERSPSCGVNSTHVGNRVTAGPGVTTALLQENGIEVRAGGVAPRSEREEN